MTLRDEAGRVRAVPLTADRPRRSSSRRCGRSTARFRANRDRSTERMGERWTKSVAVDHDLVSRLRCRQQLCEVHVQVYEHDALPCVQFPVEAALNIESDRGEVAAAVARARESLASWR